MAKEKETNEDKHRINDVSWYFPDHDISVTAASRQDADDKLKEALKNKEAAEAKE